jgi:hypothetical protein
MNEIADEDEEEDLCPALHNAEPGPPIVGRCCANDGPCGHKRLGETSVFKKRFEYDGDGKMVCAS